MNQHMYRIQAVRRSFKKIFLLLFLCLCIGTCDEPIVAPTPVISPTITSTDRLPGAQKGESYSTQLAATGGDGTYVWSKLSGDLPAGLTLSEAGTISGEPTEIVEDKNFTLRVTSAGLYADKIFLLTVDYAELKILTTELNTGTIGESYVDTLKL